MCFMSKTVKIKVSVILSLLTGIITIVSNYKGLLHISKISHEFLPSEHLPTLFSYNQQITVKIINIDYDKKRIDLVLKEML